MTHTDDTLARAEVLTYLGAIYVGQGRDLHPAFDRFAMRNRSGRWITFSRATLEKFADGALNSFRYQVTIGRAFVLMPAWWTPERRFAIRANQGRDIHGTFESKGIAEYCSLAGPIVTASLETGEEIPA